MDRSVSGLLLFVAISYCLFVNNVSADECRTRIKTIQPRQQTGDDSHEYSIIHIDGLEQNATFAECMADQPCSNGTCQQDFKLHQFLSVPYGQETFQLSDLQFRYFSIPYGCKCVP